MFFRDPSGRILRNSINENVIFQDYRKAISEWIVRGTPKDGEPFEYLGCDLWEFRDGYITKKDTYWKSIA